MLKTNEYFDGHVKSIGFDTPDGPATVGVMEKGEYTFGTSTHETMSVIAGVMAVKLPGSEAWVSYGVGEQFVVDADQSFDVRIKGHTSYLCLYK